MTDKLNARARLADWLNAFKADPFSTGEDKVDRLIALIAALKLSDAIEEDDYTPQELLERLRGFSSDSPYEEGLVAAAAKRIVELEQQLESERDDAHGFRGPGEY